MHRRAMLAADPLEQCRDLRLHRDVERGGRLVGDDQLGLGRTAPARSPPAAACRRRTGADAGRAWSPAPGCRPRAAGQRTRMRVAAAQRQMGADRLDQLLADGEQRIERGQRILEDGADAPAPDRAQLGWRQIVDALALKQDLAAGDPARRLQQPDHRGPGQRLAGTGFADQTQDLAAARSTGSPRPAPPACGARRELDAQVADLEGGRPWPWRQGASQRACPSRATTLPRLTTSWRGGQSTTASGTLRAWTSTRSASRPTARP